MLEIKASNESIRYVLYVYFFLVLLLINNRKMKNEYDVYLVLNNIQFLMEYIWAWKWNDLEIE